MRMIAAHDSSDHAEIPSMICVQVRTGVLRIPLRIRKHTVVNLAVRFPKP